MNLYLRFLIPAFLAVINLAAVDEIPDGIMPDFQSYFVREPQLLKGNPRFFDECAIAVGRAKFNPAEENRCRIQALTDARVRLAKLLSEIEVHAKKTQTSTITDNNGIVCLTEISIEEVYRSIKHKQHRIDICGEWISQDGQTLFIAVTQIYRPLKITPRPLPPSNVTDWKVEPEWERCLLLFPSLLKGGATLLDLPDKGFHILATGSAPLTLPPDKQDLMASRNAWAQALGYVKGSMVTDMQFLREQIISDADGIKEIDQFLTQRTTTQISGGLRMMKCIGTWKSSNGKRYYKAYAIAVKNIFSQIGEK